MFVMIMIPNFEGISRNAEELQGLEPQVFVYRFFSIQMKRNNAALREPESVFCEIELDFPRKMIFVFLIFKKRTLKIYIYIYYMERVSKIESI
jgi:hypothetical protein